MLNLMYLLKTQAKYYRIEQRFGCYDIYHVASGDHVARCSTQREVRNAVRAYMAGDRTKTTEGRE